MWNFFAVSSIISNSENDNIFLFDPLMEPLLILSLLVIVDLEVMAKKGYIIFLQVPELEPHHQIQISVISRSLIGEEVYSTAPANKNLMLTWRTKLALRLFIMMVKWFSHSDSWLPTHKVKLFKLLEIYGPKKSENFCYRCWEIQK